MRGRKPIPTRLKILRGNPGKRALANDESAKSSDRLPQCPSYFEGNAKRTWKRTARMLRDMGLLANVSRQTLIMYCEVYARWLDAEENLRRFGPIVVGRDKTTPTISPYLQIANQAIKQLQQLMSEFGMTPASRARLNIAPNDPQMDEFDQFLKDGK